MLTAVIASCPRPRRKPLIYKHCDLGYSGGPIRRKPDVGRGQVGRESGVDRSEQVVESGVAGGRRRPPDRGLDDRAVAPEVRERREHHLGLAGTAIAEHQEPARRQ
jgi:hypothetical protein